MHHVCTPRSVFEMKPQFPRKRARVRQRLSRSHFTAPRRHIKEEAGFIPLVILLSGSLGGVKGIIHPFTRFMKESALMAILVSSLAMNSGQD